MINFVLKALAQNGTPGSATDKTCPTTDSEKLFGFCEIENAFQQLTGFNDLFPAHVFGVLAQRVIVFFFSLAGSLAVIMIIWAGILYLTAYGNEEKVSQAKKIIIWALVGLAVVILSFTILRLVASILQT